jgi:hypothetical protein
MIFVTKLIRGDILKCQLTCCSEPAGAISLFVYMFFIILCLCLFLVFLDLRAKFLNRTPLYTSVYFCGSLSHFIKMSALCRATKLVPMIVSYM